MNAIRIREREPLPGEVVVQILLGKNPPPPKPVKDPTLKFVREQERLDGDPALFKSRATFAGL